MMELARLNVHETQELKQTQNNTEDAHDFTHDIFLTPPEILITKALHPDQSPSQPMVKTTTPTTYQTTEQPIAKTITQTTVQKKHSSLQSSVAESNNTKNTHVQHHKTPVHTAQQSMTPLSSVNIQAHNDAVKVRLDEIKTRLSRISSKVSTYINSKFTSVHQRQKILRKK